MTVALRARAELERRKRGVINPIIRSQQYGFRGGAIELLGSLEPEVIIAGPADTGKTLAGMYLLNQLCWQYPGAQMGIVRKQYSDMAGSVLQTFQSRILPKVGNVVRILGGTHPDRYIYPNGSTIWLGGMDRPGKVLSSERDVIYVNQAEELSNVDWEYLTTRANGRAGNLPYGQIIGDCNPGPPTHWIQQRAKVGHVKLIRSVHQDNPELFTEDGVITEAGVRRLASLEKLTGHRRQRLLRGLWVAPDGAIYDVFDEDRHKAVSFEMPSMWPRFVGVDPLGAFTAAVWLAIDPKALVVHVYREYYQPFGITTSGHATNVRRLSENEPVFAWIGGARSENQARIDWTAAGVPLIEPPISDVWAGIDRVSDLMASDRLVVHDTCVNLLSEIGSYQRHLQDGQPTESIENKDAYHLLDALRYVIAWLTEPSEQGELVYLPTTIGRY